MSGAAKIELFWYQTSWLTRLLWPLSLIFLLLAKMKRWLYLVGVLQAQSSDVPVLVVGNITVGGTGKTPLIRYLVKSLTNKGFKVGIVSRGYKAKLNQTSHLISGDDTVEQIGDEAFMQFRVLDCPMAIGRDRAAAVKLLAGSNDLDLIISDDGLQHYAMARQFEVIVVDGRRVFGNRLMLPFGPLREPVSRLKSADSLVINGELENQDILSQCQSVSQMKVVVDGLVHIKSGEVVSLTNLRENSVTAIAGIGNPQRFFDSISAYCQPVSQLTFDDHHDFKIEDFQNIDSDIIVMTEKDAVKCSTFAKDNWYYLRIKVDIMSQQGASLIELIESQLL